MTETDLQNQIRMALSPYGVVIRQNTGNFQLKDGRRIMCGVKGLSDLLFIGQNRVAFIEVKTETGKPTPEQLNFIKRAQELGHSAGIARSVEDALRLAGVIDDSRRN
ncbi:MAG: VRR-NUC domain-containing protein [Ruminiclostridium sp.]